MKQETLALGFTNASEPIETTPSKRLPLGRAMGDLLRHDHDLNAYLLLRGRDGRKYWADRQQYEDQSRKRIDCLAYDAEDGSTWDLIARVNLRPLRASVRIEPNVCDVCRGEVTYIMGCPDGRELCQGCFDEESIADAMLESIHEEWLEEKLEPEFPKATPALIEQLKEAEQDFEFYPTTNEILLAVMMDLELVKEEQWRRRPLDSVLDIGAGHGKALRAFQAAGFQTLYAIEKSEILRQQLPPEFYVIGTAFEEQSLMSKVVDVIFCNPPYSVYEEWAAKIIRQSAAPLVYLVIPRRWEESVLIADALKYREAETRVVGCYDFEDAKERAARAQVHVLRVELSWSKEDAFDRAFGEQFKGLIDRCEAKGEPESKDTSRKPNKFSALVMGENYFEAIVNLYLADMAHIERQYAHIAELDPDLMHELGVTPKAILGALRQRLSGLRTQYWQEVFDRLDPINRRLTAASRDRILSRLQKHVHVDFTVDNIYAVLLWVIKNANGYLDQQLIETYGHMIDKANVVLYKSNQRPFVQNRWRYCQEDGNSHFALDYRIVMHSCGGIHTNEWRSWEAEQCGGLDQRAHSFLRDLITIANNLGFPTGKGLPLVLTMGKGPQWFSNKPHSFYYQQPGKAKPELLFEARAFKKGNMHLRLAKKFALALNVEYGRLKGWLHSGEQAAEELGQEEAAEHFKSNLSLPTGNPVLSLAA